MLKQFENHPDFSGILCSVREEYSRRGTFFLEEPYLRELHARLGLFPRSIDAICRDAAAIRGGTGEGGVCPVCGPGYGAEGIIQKKSFSV